MSEQVNRCPHCGSKEIAQDAVDIGVGTQYGPARCEACNWPCQCEENKCKATPCKGECGCRSCHDDYQDFLSME